MIMIWKNIWSLAQLLSMSSIDGCIALAAHSGLFLPSNTLLISFTMIAGPSALIIASLFEGAFLSRVLTALFAGLIATISVMIAAGVGPKILDFLNLDIMKFFGGVAIITIGLLVMGIKIPEKLPIATIMFGIILGVIWR